ncbi:MAG: hypothetical protein MUC90_01975 [Thermoplasmata archaeon]|jgi:hypothetical protein|nr:hypothetical protein [Thermoplasmata archaeon]
MTAAKRKVVEFGYPRYWFVILALVFESLSTYLFLFALLDPDAVLREVWLVLGPAIGVPAFLFLIPPLFTKHLAGERALRLKMGLLIDATIPYAVIKEVKDTTVHRGGVRVGIGARYFPISKALFVTSSFSDLVMIRFHDEMLIGKLVKKPVEELVLSVNNKSLFIETVKTKAGLMKEV